MKIWGMLAIVALAGNGCSFDAPIKSAGVDGLALRTANGDWLRVSVKPVADGRLSSVFGDARGGWFRRRSHKGIDYAAPSGTAVYAAGWGCVTSLGWRQGYGRLVVLRHDPWIETAYAHLADYAPGLSQGQCLGGGELLGYVGSSGNATGAHLHYEVRYRGEPIDPLIN